VKKRATLALCVFLATIGSGRIFAQSIADQLPLYVISSFSKADYDPLPVLKNLVIIEAFSKLRRVLKKLP
jgi:hypothetical protein